MVVYVTFMYWEYPGEWFSEVVASLAWVGALLVCWRSDSRGSSLLQIMALGYNIVAL